ncbi:hypothetical protein PF005_g16816, partial [Phytophthora fragariae]
MCVVPAVHAILPQRRSCSALCCSAIGLISSSLPIPPRPTQVSHSTPLHPSRHHLLRIRATMSKGPFLTGEDCKSAFNLFCCIYGIGTLGMPGNFARAGPAIAVSAMA